jgi:hypothetical protein
MSLKKRGVKNWGQRAGMGVKIWGENYKPRVKRNKTTGKS